MERLGSQVRQAHAEAAAANQRADDLNWRLQRQEQSLAERAHMASEAKQVTDVLSEVRPRACCVAPVHHLCIARWQQELQALSLSAPCRAYMTYGVSPACPFTQQSWVQVLCVSLHHARDLKHCCAGGTVGGAREGGLPGGRAARPAGGCARLPGRRAPEQARGRGRPGRLRGLPSPQPGQRAGRGSRPAPSGAHAFASASPISSSRCRETSCCKDINFLRGPVSFAVEKGIILPCRISMCTRRNMAMIT